jgi:hypothetical protein
MPDNAVGILSEYKTDDHVTERGGIAIDGLFARSLQNCMAIVTGTSQCIGRAMATELAVVGEK